MIRVLFLIFCYRFKIHLLPYITFFLERKTFSILIGRVLIYQAIFILLLLFILSIPILRFWLRRCLTNDSFWCHLVIAVPWCLWFFCETAFEPLVKQVLLLDPDLFLLLAHLLQDSDSPLDLFNFSEFLFFHHFCVSRRYFRRFKLSIIDSVHDLSWIFSDSQCLLSDTFAYLLYQNVRFIVLSVQIFQCLVIYFNILIDGIFESIHKVFNKFCIHSCSFWIN